MVKQTGEPDPNPPVLGLPRLNHMVENLYEWSIGRPRLIVTEFSPVAPRRATTRATFSPSRRHVAAVTGEKPRVVNPLAPHASEPSEGPLGAQAPESLATATPSAAR